MVKASSSRRRPGMRSRNPSRRSPSPHVCDRRRALADAERMPRSADRIRSVLRELASENLTQALGRMAPLAGHSLALPGSAAALGRDADETEGTATLSHIAALDN